MSNEHDDPRAREAPEGWSAISDALRADHATEMAAFETERDIFADGVALRLAEAEEAHGAESVGQLLRDQTQAALADRDGTWPAFTAQVLHALDETSPSDLANQAIAELRQDVTSELDVLASRFDRDFREGVERRIFRAGQTDSAWWSSWTERVGQWMRSPPSLGFAAAAAAVCIAVVGPRLPLGSDATEVPGHVSIEAVRFDGVVTVMPDDGIAVMWVSDDAS